ncbi:MAG: hypothetical protein O7D32_06285 [bacterium]|nr:hypothetical protein [bacterium]
MIDQMQSSDLSFPEDAYEFVRQGLPFTVRRTHGKPSDEQSQLEKWLRDNQIELDQFEEMFEQGELPEEIQEFTDSLGGPQALSRHVSGQELCWGLRDLAIKRWGLLARTVLTKWKVRHTEDFGKIVFALIEQGQLRKQLGDTLDDFKDVFDFNEAFDTSRITDPPD